MSKILFMGNVDRVKYRFGREYIPEVIVKSTEKSGERVICELDNGTIMFNIGEKVHLKNIGDVVILDQRRYITGEIIYDTDYVVEIVEDEVTSHSLEESKKQYNEYQELREKICSKMESERTKEKKVSWFKKITG